jgi:RNA polymerase sigma factor (sigma-70 family)
MWFIVFLVLVKLKGQEMRKFKTREAYRHTYAYYFSDGTMQTIEVSDEVTLGDIAFLHQLDDDEVDRERRHKYLVPSYIEGFSTTDEECLPTNPLLVEDKTPIEILIQYENGKEREKVHQALHQAMESLTSKQKRTIEKIFYQGMRQAEVAREEGVSKMKISDRLTSAYKKIKKELKIFQKNTLLS